MSTPRLLSPARVSAALVPAAGVSAYAAVVVGQGTDTLGAWWPAAGLGIVATLLVPARRRPLVVASLFAALTAANAVAGRDLLTSALLGLADVTETVVVVALLVRLTGGRLRSLPDVTGLVVASAAGAAVAGVTVGAVYAARLDVDATALVPLVTLGHGVSTLALAPLAMVRWRGPVRGWQSALVHGVLTAALLLLSYGLVTEGLAGLLALTLPVPLVVWASVRQDLRTVVALVVGLACTITLAAALFPRRFGSDGTALGTVQVSQVYLLLCVLVALPLAMAMREREDAVRLVRDSETTYRRAFTRSGLPAMLCTWDGRRLVVDLANLEAAALLDRPGADLAGRDLQDVLDVPHLVVSLGAGPLADFAGWSGPVPVPGAPQLHLEGSCSLVTVRAEHDALLSLTLVDLTARHRLQHHLEAERTWTRAVMDSAASMIVVTDTAGTVTAVNPAAERLTGYAAHELVGRPLWDTMVPSRLRHLVADAVSQVLPIPRSGELEIRTRTGERRTVQFTHAAHRTSPVAATDGDGSGTDGAALVFSATDVTEARESAGVVDHLLRTVTSLAFVRTDLQGRVTMFSAGAERLLGTTAAEVDGRPLVQLLGHVPSEATTGSDGLPDQRLPRHPRFAELVRHPGPESSPSTSDWLVLPQDREPVRVSVTCSPVRSDLGTVHGYLFVARDVTETRRNQEILVNALRREREVVTRLQDLDRARDDFISTVSHELRTPMSSIIGSAELLADGMVGELDPPQQQLVDVITRNGDRLLDLADDLLTLATFDQGGRSAREGELDLRDVVSQSVRTVQPQRTERDLAWKLRLPHHPVVVVGDPSHLERAVTNLLTNAVKFTPDGGRIEATLRADVVRQTATIAVRDTGQGIAAGALDHVFERFFRSDEAQQQAIQGTGLGLAIVKSIVESHEGRVTVDSAEGEGTTVTISLPLASISASRHLV